MAQIPDSPKKQRHPRTRRTSNFLLGCFGFSESPYDKVKENSTPKKISSSSGRLKLGFPWRSSSSQKSPKKAAPEKLDDDQKRKEIFRMVRMSKKFSSNNQLAQEKEKEKEKVPGDGSAPLSQIPAAVGSDDAVHGKANKKKEEKSQKKIILENGKSVNHSDSIPKEGSTLKKGAPSRKNSTSQPSEADKNEVMSRAELSHSVLMPPAPAGGGHTAESSGGAVGKEEEEDERRKNESWAGKFDQLVGMSIIVVTLLIMIIWGKVCAILCTSAWLYFYPTLLRVTTSSRQKIDHQSRNMVMMRNGTNTKSLDLVVDSQKHKKKVVFEGFLERNHRVN